MKEDQHKDGSCLPSDADKILSYPISSHFLMVSFVGQPGFSPYHRQQKKKSKTKEGISQKCKKTQCHKDESTQGCSLDSLTKKSAWGS